ncbi:STAS domain-containing protein [Streptomyces sp. NPDC017936]|uniref:STAS domain-containing protein n=1 Tax=Streptomyces sp. NPDC017936 TaxID=3365016 RepID=UPI0037B45E96
MHGVPDRKVHVVRHEEVFVILIRGETDHDDVDEFEAAWDAADRAALPTTAIDLSQVTFADSMLLNALLDARRRHASAGRDLVLLGPLSPAVSRLLVLSGTLEHFRIADTGPTPTS